MAKIDYRKNYIILIDTETCPIDNTIDGVNPNNMLVYDIGYRIIDRHNNCYVERSFVVDDIFFGEYEKMRTSYYYDKLPNYYHELAQGSIFNTSWESIVDIMREDIELYHINTIAAHNARFDCIALNTTAKYLNKGYMLPYGIEWWDTLKMANSTFGKYKKYRKFCEDNNYMTKHKTPRPRMTAECIYRYLTKDTNFIEEHRAIYDARIESEILKACFDTHRPMVRKLWKQASLGSSNLLV